MNTNGPYFTWRTLATDLVQPMDIPGGTTIFWPTKTKKKSRGCGPDKSLELSQSADHAVQFSLVAVRSDWKMFFGTNGDGRSLTAKNPKRLPKRVFLRSIYLMNFLFLVEKKNNNFIYFGSSCCCVYKAEVTWTLPLNGQVQCCLPSGGHFLLSRYVTFLSRLQSILVLAVDLSCQQRHCNYEFSACKMSSAKHFKNWTVAARWPLGKCRVAAFVSGRFAFERSGRSKRTKKTFDRAFLWLSIGIWTWWKYANWVAVIEGGSRWLVRSNNKWRPLLVTWIWNGDLVWACLLPFFFSDVNGRFFNEWPSRGGNVAGRPNNNNQKMNVGYDNYGDGKWVWKRRPPSDGIGWLLHFLKSLKAATTATDLESNYVTCVYRFADGSFAYQRFTWSR